MLTIRELILDLKHHSKEIDGTHMLKATYKAHKKTLTYTK